MKLVTFNEGRVGRIRDGKTIEELDVPSMREYFEGGETAAPTGKTFLLDDVRLRAPSVPKAVPVVSAENSTAWAVAELRKLRMPARKFITK